MKYIIDDKQLNAKTFIQFVNQIWLGNYDLPKPQNALTKTINITVWDNTIWVGCLRILTNGCFFWHNYRIAGFTKISKTRGWQQTASSGTREYANHAFFGAQPGLEKFYEKTAAQGVCNLILSTSRIDIQNS